MKGAAGRLGGIFMIVRRSLKQHALSTMVTATSVALGCGLVMAVFSIDAQAYRAFTGGEVGFDAVLGARGSKLQLVLNTVFHLETSPGNISWELYENMLDDKRVELAIPYAVGDNYRGFRIVGTTEEMFTEFEDQAGKKFELQPGGIVFDSERMEAVVGSIVAEKTGLRVGSIFHPSHGVDDGGGHHHHEDYVVVGVMKPTSSPSDRVIWIPIEGVFHMSGHVLRGAGEEFHASEHEAVPDKHKEVSAVMLKLRGRGGVSLSQEINMQGNEATLAWPITQSLAELFQKLGWMSRVLGLVAYLVMAVAAASILASIYNTMNERRRELAILRALGAKRRTVFAVVLLEAGAIAALGSLLGYGVYLMIFASASDFVLQQAGVVLDAGSYHSILLVCPAIMIGLGIVAGLLPAFRAYRTDVASNLVAAG